MSSPLRRAIGRLGGYRAKRALAGAPGAGHANRQRLYRHLHHTALVGRNFGAASVDTSGETELLHRLREHEALAVALDVGANSGAWSMLVADLWPSAQVHAFEPARTSFDQLTRVTAGSGVICVQAALGRGSGSALLHSVEGQPGLSSLTRRDLREHALQMTAEEEVQVLALDEYCAEAGIHSVDFLKIDAEGHDLDVLLGASGLLSEHRIRFIQFEFGGANIDTRTYLRDFVRLLEQSYRLYRLLADGLEELCYDEREEIFVTANYLAVLRGELQR